MFEPAGPTTWGNGCCEPANFKDGATVLNMKDLVNRFYFAAAIRVSERPI